MRCRAALMAWLAPHTRLVRWQGDKEFNTEAALLARLRHPHVVALLGVCATGDHRIAVRARPLRTGRQRPPQAGGLACGPLSGGYECERVNACTHYTLACTLCCMSTATPPIRRAARNAAEPTSSASECTRPAMPPHRSGHQLGLGRRPAARRAARRRVPQLRSAPCML